MTAEWGWFGWGRLGEALVGGGVGWVGVGHVIVIVSRWTTTG